MKDILLSVGIDIGTSTTQLVFSNITVENVAAGYTVPRMEITDKKIIYKSDIYFTPLKSATEIDADKVVDIIKSEYEKAGVSIHDPDTGAVIITGETARKENARAVLERLSAFSGDFVVATAGADLESVISGKGAGCDRLSKEKHTVCANLDIGGGTTNIAVFNRGKTADTACFDIGGRLIKFDSHKTVTYISPKIKKIIEDKRLPLAEGSLFNEAACDEILSVLVSALCRAFGIGNCPYYDLLITHKGLEFEKNISCLTFSGGVAEGIYHSFSDPYTFGDIGLLLGKKIKESPLFSKFKVEVPTETIRATVVGAGSHTTEISGSTVYYDPSLLPLKSLPVLKIEDENNMTEEFNQKIRWFDEGQTVALSIKGTHSPTFSALEETAAKISAALSGYEKPPIVVFEEDMGKAAGYSLQQKFPSRKLISIDGISLKEGDYIDIGKPISDGTVLPVIVKTLLFQ